MVDTGSGEGQDSGSDSALQDAGLKVYRKHAAKSFVLLLLPLPVLLLRMLL